MITFIELDDFKRDLKKLSKKHKTIREDLEVVKKVLNISPNARPPFTFQISDLGIKNCIIKVKKIASKSFKGRGVQSGFRLVYAYYKETNKIIFVELYHKSTKEMEDRQRILRNFG